MLANGTTAAGYSFDVVGVEQTMRYGNGVTNQFQYDRLNRLTNMVWKLNATTLASFDHQLGFYGNRTNLSEVVNSASRTYGWTYDSLYRLKQETLGGGTSGTLSYGFDSVGNRTNRTVSGLSLTNQSFTFNTNDWLSTDQYDNNGNTTNWSGVFYQFDALNHLTNVNSGTVRIIYDGDGNRVAKTVGGTTTYYLLDDHNPSGYVQVLEELDIHRHADLEPRLQLRLCAHQPAAARREHELFCFRRPRLDAGAGRHWRQRGQCVCLRCLGISSLPMQRRRRLIFTAASSLMATLSSIISGREFLIRARADSSRRTKWLATRTIHARFTVTYLGPTTRLEMLTLTASRSSLLMAQETIWGKLMAAKRAYEYSEAVLCFHRSTRVLRSRRRHRNAGVEFSWTSFWGGNGQA